MKKKLATLIFTVYVAMAFFACGNLFGSSAPRVGYGSGYMFAPVFVAGVNLGRNIDTQRFHSLSDAAYMLHAGRLDASFLEAERLIYFSEMGGFEQITVVGKITYPFGATLILRQGLGKRLHEIAGLNIAVSSSQCALRRAFLDDVNRLSDEISDVDWGNLDEINWTYMSFGAMLPALEAGVVDGAIITGVHSAAALNAGHSILYQNWNLEAGDGCCPAVIDQTILLLLARKDRVDTIHPFLQALVEAQEKSPDYIRVIASANTRIPTNVLETLPIPSFELADDELAQQIIASARKGCSLGQHKHKHERRHKGEESDDL